MAHSPIPRPDPFDPLGRGLVGEPSAAGKAAAVGPAQTLSQWENTLSACGGGTLGAELALDLVLNNIVERARLDGNATAAAIALVREGEIVCRATTGENAPGLGVRLNTQSGLSAACVQSGKWQHCEDTELDERVDPEVCRQLGVRSIVVYPIVKKGELLGIIEIFGSRPNAFGSREIRALGTLAAEVVESVDRANPPQSISSEQEPFVEVGNAGMESLQPEVPTTSIAIQKKRDIWTDVLSLLVIALAVVLGWVVGRGGFRNAVTRSSSQIQQAGTLAGSGGASLGGQELARQSGGLAPANEESISPTPENGLTIYRGEKVVFRAPGQKEDAASKQPPSAVRSDDVRTPDLKISPEIANEYLTHRVEPEYPEAARVRGIQGPVVLDVIVGKDGEVQQVSSVQGDAKLAAAAADAIRQWRFQPFFRDGQPEAFQTRVTLDFRLP